MHEWKVAGTLAVVTSGLVLSVLSDEPADPGACVYWATAQRSQDDSQLVKLDPRSGASLANPSVSGAGYTATVSQSIVADGSRSLVGTGPIYAGSVDIQTWQIIDTEAEPIAKLDQPDLRYAMISPDGTLIAYTRDAPDPDRTYGVQTIDGEIVWEYPQDAVPETWAHPVRWLDDQVLWLQEASSGVTFSVDVDGSRSDPVATPTEPITDGSDREWPAIKGLIPSADLEHFVGTHGRTLYVYDGDFNELLHPPNALPYSAQWISDDVIVYLRQDGHDAYIRADSAQPPGAPIALVAMSVRSQASEVVMDDVTYGLPHGWSLNTQSLVTNCG